MSHLNRIITRMHSSRMRTGRSLTVCRSLLPGRGGGCKKKIKKCNKKCKKKFGGEGFAGGGDLLLGGGSALGGVSSMH